MSGLSWTKGMPRSPQKASARFRIGAADGCLGSKLHKASKLSSRTANPLVRQRGPRVRENPEIARPLSLIWFSPSGCSRGTVQAVTIRQMSNRLDRLEQSVADTSQPYDLALASQWNDVSGARCHALVSKTEPLPESGQACAPILRLREACCGWSHATSAHSGWASGDVWSLPDIFRCGEVRTFGTRQQLGCGYRRWGCPDFR